MSNYSFLVPNNYQTLNPNGSYPNYTRFMGSYGDHNHHHHHLDFELSDYLAMADQLDETLSSSDFTACLSQDPILHETTHTNGSCSVNSMDGMQTNNNMKCRSGSKRQKMDMGYRIAFRTMTELEIMDDGYKWRKYGKKRVKSSPYPRNYYKCVSGGCMVKKRVEKDREDSRYVITTYEGVHNHESPTAIYCNEMVLPSGSRMQASHCSS